MKKKIVCSLLFVAMVWHLHAQNQKGYISISLGPSLPTGDFASTNYNNNEAGWSKTGAVIDIAFTHKFSQSHWGIAAMLRGQTNPLDAQGIADEVASQVPGVLITVTTTNWQIGSLWLGTYGSFPFSEKAAFDTRAMIGFLRVTAPEITTTAITAFGSEWIKQSSSTTSTFGYLLGAGFRFDLGEKLSFLTQADYMSSKPKFKDVETTSSMGDYEKETKSQKIQTVNVSIGLAFKF